MVWYSCLFKDFQQFVVIHTVKDEITWNSLVAQTVKHLPTTRETQVRSLAREDPLEKEMATHSSPLPRKFHGWRSLMGYSPWGCKESDKTEQLSLYSQRL